MLLTYLTSTYVVVYTGTLWTDVKLMLVTLIIIIILLLFSPYKKEDV